MGGDSADGGATFEEIGLDLKAANHPLRLIVFSPDFATDHTLFGAGSGFAKSTDGGVTWTIAPLRAHYDDRQLNSLTIGGDFNRLSDPAAGATALGASATTGDTVAVNFVGACVSWIATVGPDQGIADVYIDGVLRATVDQYAATRQTLVRPVRATGLAPGLHTIVVEVTGLKNPASADTRVEFDAFEVEPRCQAR